jgi:glycosyltransferase involved in cell wall biosynthesis
MTGIDVDIIVITYNHEKLIERCLKSIINQKTNKKIRIIINDDCSNDLTASVINKIIAKEKNQKNIYFDFKSHQKNIGMHENFFDAFSRAEARYISFCEGDDGYHDPLKLEKQIDFLERNQDYFLCFHDAYIYDLNNNIRGKFSTGRKAINSAISQEISLKNMIESPLRAWHINTILVRNINLPSIEELKWIRKHPVVDFPFLTMLFSRGRCYYLAEQLSYYRTNPDSITQTRSHNFKYFMKINKMLTETNEKTNFIHKRSFAKKQISNLYHFFSNTSEKNFIYFLLLFLPRILLSNYSQHTYKDHLYLIRKRAKKCFGFL